MRRNSEACSSGSSEKTCHHACFLPVSISERWIRSPSLTIPISLPCPSMTGTELTRFDTRSRAASTSEVSGVVVITSRVMTSAARMGCLLASIAIDSTSCGQNGLQESDRNPRYRCDDDQAGDEREHVADDGL